MPDEREVQRLAGDDNARPTYERATSAIVNLDHVVHSRAGGDAISQAQRIGHGDPSSCAHFPVPGYLPAGDRNRAAAGAQLPTRLV